MRITVAVLLAAVLLCAPPAGSSPVGCGSLGGAVQDGLCHVVDIQPESSPPAYKVDMTFPLDYPDEQAIIDYLSQTREGFLAVARTPGSRNLPYEMNVTAESFRSPGTRSVVLTLFQDIGSAHPTTWYKSFTFDLQRARPLTFETLFAPGAQPLPAIYPVVKRELETRTGLSGSIGESDGMDPAHYQNFAITEKAVIFFFGRAELLPSYAGAISVAVPRDVLPPLQV